MAGLILAFALTGCRGCEKKEVDNNTYKEKEDDISVSNNVVETEGLVMTSLAGYEKKGTKKALISCSGKETGFTVIDTETGKEAASGRIRYGETQSVEGKTYGICDFTSLEKEGSFYLQTDSGISSEEFVIKESLYRKLLKVRIKVSDEAGAGREDIDRYNLGKNFLYVTDLVLAEEFFGEQEEKANVNKKDKNKDDNGRSKKNNAVIPDSINAAKLTTDKLKKLMNEHGVLDTSLRADCGIYYQYGAVMSLFAYEYGQYDSDYAEECSVLAEASYKHAEEMYSKGSGDVKRKADDKRFWAAAQLYKLTGEPEYRETAEAYAGDPPEGFCENKNGYLGTIAYLTSYNKIDLDIGEMFIMALMEDINEVIKKESVDAFLTAAVKGDGEEQISDAFETARLMVLGNYITKNIKYVDTAESYLDYLYGMNMLGKDYAYDSSSDHYSEPQAFILAGLIDSYIYEDKEPEAMGRMEN